MELLKFDLTKKLGGFKILNATNGGPRHKRHATDQYITNLKEYKAARIPFSRNHDSNICGIAYGGPFVHDISAIFPNFDADVNNPESYDFACTDETILTTLEAGTETFFRLGESIEHQIKKHHTLPPKDFKKWAEICEHVIRHYNEGWADGLNLNIQYWEIWNEPDLDDDDSQNKRTWGGTKAQFFDFYEIAAKHLKKCFPNLKIGGPALAEHEDWADDFLKEMKKREVPIDFFSWHIYCVEPCELIARAKTMKRLLCNNGYGDVETILNEWNYIKGWTEEFVYSLECVKGIKGAAFVMACMSEAQKCDALDMLMYYDTRPSLFNGVFDEYSRPIKGYYPFYWYGMFYDMESEVRCQSNPENIYSLCGVDKNGKVLCIITHYSDNDNAEEKEITVDFGREGVFEVHLLDSNHNGEIIKTTGETRFTLENCSCIMLKETN